MNLLTANYSSCGSRLPPRLWDEPSHSVLPNEVVYIAHSFGLSAFRLQCLGCEDFVRLLSAAFNINPRFVQPADSTHLREAQEMFLVKFMHSWSFFDFPVMYFSKMTRLSVLVSQEVLQIPKFCFPFDVERYDSSPSLLPCFQRCNSVFPSTYNTHKHTWNDLHLHWVSSH